MKKQGANVDIEPSQLNTKHKMNDSKNFEHISQYHFNSQSTHKYAGLVKLGIGSATGLTLSGCGNEELSSSTVQQTIVSSKPVSITQVNVEQTSVASAPTESVRPTNEPIVSSAEPVASSAEPVASSAEPVASSVEPVASSVEPVVSPAEPLATSVDPNSLHIARETTPVTEHGVPVKQVHSHSTARDGLPSRPTPDHPEEPLPPFLQPTTTTAARFLHQAQFHASDEDIANVINDGFEGWLDNQLNMPITITGWDWLMQSGYNNTDFRFSSIPMTFMMWQQLITSPDSVRKRIALALSEIIVVGTTTNLGDAKSFALAAYWDVLNKHAFGNYRDLLQDISLNLAMGYYLNTRGNRKENEKTGRQPDENYARELLQLFTIGLHELNMDGSPKLKDGKPIETYTNEDVISLARVFTGYNRGTLVYDSPERPYATKTPLQLNPNYHSLKEKQFLGLNIPADTEAAPSLQQALDHIFNHENVAPFISKQLIQRLVTSNPSADYVERIAHVFSNNGEGVRGDLKAVTKAILLDQEARDDIANQSFGFGKLREPMLRVLQLVKTFKPTSVSGKWETFTTQSYLGQGFLNSPSVFNFFRPGYIPPNTIMAENDMVAPEFQITTETNNTNYFNYMRLMVERGLWRFNDWRTNEVALDYSEELALVEKPSALVSRLNKLLTANQLLDATVLLITNTVAAMKSEGEQWKEKRVWAAVWLVMCAPEYMVQK